MRIKVLCICGSSFFFESGFDEGYPDHINKPHVSTSEIAKLAKESYERWQGDHRECEPRKEESDV